MLNNSFNIKIIFLKNYISENKLLAFKLLLISYLCWHLCGERQEYIQTL